MSSPHLVECCSACCCRRCHVSCFCRRVCACRRCCRRRRVNLGPCPVSVRGSAVLCWISWVPRHRWRLSLSARQICVVICFALSAFLGMGQVVLGTYECFCWRE